jgi:caffeoyl-CoA O-methyltransferase
VNQESLEKLDSYIEGLFGGEDEALRAAVEDSKKAGLPEIQISANQGRFLRLLAELSGARRILEVGTLGGYSGIHFARALPEDGVLVTLELEEGHAGVARKSFARAGVSEKVEVRVGDAKAMMREMVETGGEEPFDLVFIDAEKEGYFEYLDLSLDLSRPGTLIIADNVVRGGDVLEEGNMMRAFNEKFASHGRLDGIIVPLIREYVDGVAIARVK